MKQFISEILPFVALFSMLWFASCKAQEKLEMNIIAQEKGNALYEVGDEYGVFYSGDACFWCTEGIWDNVPGVVDVKSGYLGGSHPANPTYQDHGNYAEGNKITYDPNIISISELIEYYFLVHSFGRSPDRGQSYRAVLHVSEKEKAIAKKHYNNAVRQHGKFQQDLIVGQINWFDAEDYHQDYLKRLDAGKSVPNVGYGMAESVPRRARAVEKIKKKQNEKKLTKKQAYIMLDGGTERPFSSPLNSEKRSGVYVSPATGDTLFHSSDKFVSGSGWPSFDSSTDKVGIGNAEQGGYEIIEKSTGYHLGHLFMGEGFTSENKRFCVNGDALLFVPDEK